ncbi:hypothetical protein B0H66DRAFT_569252 [Apodospora peruviana]|uniref:Uncharacterized protein n=1 Tax=Apodospora peruviana TaxID=516989 RepID=A0AAE0HUI5_9PEZI|nr:hypothetical protein B0H66DRAFT_569252 [Apodospora peruviana]
MSIIMIRRKGNGAARRGVAFDSSWPFSKEWVQMLRRPENLASVCLDGYLGMNFDEENESYHRRYVIRMMWLLWRGGDGEREIYSNQGGSTTSCHVCSLAVFR